MQCVGGTVSLQAAEGSVSTAIQANPLFSLRKPYVTSSSGDMQPYDLFPKCTKSRASLVAHMFTQHPHLLDLVAARCEIT